MKKVHIHIIELNIINDFIKSKYYFVINGTIDDFINIGILLYHTEIYDKVFYSDLFWKMV